MKLHLPKGLFTAILAAFAVVTTNAYGADSISISFGSTTMDGVTDVTSHLGGVTKDGWNIVAASNTSGTAVRNQDGAAAGILVMSGIFGSYSSSVNTTTTVTGVVQQNYIDIKNHSGGNVHTISLNHNYWLADVTYYLSGDAGGTWAPMEVNGTQYIGGIDNTLDAGENAAWGTRGGVTTYDETNSITVTGLTGTIVGKNVYTSTTARATLGGMQVVDSSATRGYTTTLGAGETSASEASWSLNGQGVEYDSISASKKNLGVSAAAEGSTLKLDGGDSVNSIAVQANTLTVASDDTIGLNDIYLNSGTTFNLNAGITSVTNLSVRGAGTANINASQTLGNLNLYSDLTLFGISNNATVSVNGAFSIGNSTALTIAEGSTLALKGNVDGSFILNTTGSGTIELNNGGTVIIPGANNGKPGDGGTASAVNSTAFAGVISVKSGTLSLGDNGDDQNYWGLNLGSLKSIDLDGGSMRLFGAASTISTINVNTASSMTIHQASVTQGAANEATSGLPGYRINNLVLNENLSIRTTWRSVVEIGKLSGAADLSMDTAGSDRVLSLYVNKVDATAGMNMNFAANVNATLGGAANSELTDVSHTLGGTITTAANLTVNGNITIVDDLSAFVMLSRGSESGELSVNGTDGYMTITGSTYLLVDNTGSGTVTFTPTTATYAGGTINLTQDATGDVTFVGGTSLDTIYRVNTADVTVGGSNATADTARATSFIVAGGHTVTIAGAADNASTGGMLYNTTGAGNVTLTADASLAQQQITQATGKLAISGARLNLGNSDLNASDYSVPGASIASFTSVELDRGTIYVNNPDGTINNLSVTANGGTIEVYDLGQTEDDKWLTLSGTTTLTGNLNLASNWNSQIAVDKLAGTGNLVVDDTRSENMILNINGKDDGYSGQVQVKGNAGNLQVNVTENLGLDVHVSTRSGEMNLNGIAVGNQIILQGASGSMTAGSTVVADVKIENSADGAYAGMEIATAADNATMKYTGTITGGGNYIVAPSKSVTVDGTEQQVGVSTTTEFAGDTSGWSGKMEVVNGTQNIIFSGSETINNSNIQTRRDNNATNTDPVMNLTIKHDTAAVTVNSAISGSVNMTVNAAGGATFTNAVTVNSTSIAAGTTATFDGASNLGSLTLGDGASIAGAGDLTIGELILDLQSYTSDFGQSHTLVSTTGTLNFTGDLSQFQNVTVGDYTANVEQNGNAITLSFSAPDAPDTSIITTVTGQGGFDAGMLTLNVAADLTNATQQVLISGISDSIMADILGLSGLPENGMVGITLAGANGTNFTASADQQIGFQGNDGVSYYFGEMVGGNWQYQAAYIPEPATATLSLLALAGLAARRRRKH